MRVIGILQPLPGDSGQMTSLLDHFLSCEVISCRVKTTSCE